MSGPREEEEGEQGERVRSFVGSDMGLMQEHFHVLIINSSYFFGLKGSYKCVVSEST